MADKDSKKDVSKNITYKADTSKIRFKGGVSPNKRPKK